MNRLEAALVDIAGHLDGQKLPYMVIGGFATLYWGRPRLTEDVDVKVQVDEPAWPAMISALQTRFEILVEQPLAFMRETRVVPVATRTGVRVDLVLAGLPYDVEAIRRARDVSVQGRTVRICAPEDLILHKIISDRSRDRDDVEGVILSQARSLDRVYLDPRVREISDGLVKPDIVVFYEACLKKAGLGES